MIDGAGMAWHQASWHVADGWSFHGPEHGLEILDSSRMWLMFERQLMRTWGCSLSLIERDGWISYPTSSDMGSRSVQRYVDIMLEYHDRGSHDDLWSRWLLLWRWDVDTWTRCVSTCWLGMGSFAHGDGDMMEFDTLLWWTCSLSWKDQPSTMESSMGRLWQGGHGNLIYDIHWYGCLGGNWSLRWYMMEMELYICCRDVFLIWRSPHHGVIDIFVPYSIEHEMSII